MAKKKVGHYVQRPGRNPGDADVVIPVAEDLETVPGIPLRESDVAFFSREDPLENMAIAESASADWARRQRSGQSPELLAFYEEHQHEMEPIVEWVRSSGNLQTTGTPTGEDVSELSDRRHASSATARWGLPVMTAIMCTRAASP